MAVSTNLKYHRNNTLIRRFFSGFRASLNGSGTTGLGGAFKDYGGSKKFCYKAGVPGATDTPVALHDICEDITGGHVYLNTTYDAGGASNVWTQLF